MACLARGTIAVAACEGKLLAAVGFERAGLLAAADEHLATVRTGRALGSASGLPVGGAAAQGQVLEHAGSHAIPTLIECLLNFS